MYLTDLKEDIKKIESYRGITEIEDIEIYSIALKQQYDNDQYIIMANTYIGKRVELPASKRYPQSEYFIEKVTDIPRNIQQRIAGSNSSSWSNMIYLFNKYSDQKIEPKTTLDIMKSLGKDTQRIEEIVTYIQKKYGEN